MTAALVPVHHGDVAREAPGRRRPYLVPVPDCEPPFDDEAHGCPHHGGTAACPAAPAAGPGFAARHQVWPAPQPMPTASGRPWPAPQPKSTASGRPWPAPQPMSTATPTPTPTTTPTTTMTTTSHRPDGGPVRAQRAAAPSPAHRTATPRHRPVPGTADHSARMLARAVVEVLSGHRPAQQLRTFCRPDVLDEMRRNERIRTPTLPHVMSVRVCEPADGVAEATAVYRRGDRVRMVAFRIERQSAPGSAVVAATPHPPMPAERPVDSRPRWAITAIALG